jgi:hypothetical protein
MLLLASAASLLLLLGGCVTAPHQWTATGATPYGPPSQGYAVMLPQGWVEISSRDYSGTIVSRHGLDLEIIRIVRTDNDKAFPVLKKSASPDEEPGQLADDLIAEIKTESGITGFKLVTNEPTTLAGKVGIHLVIEFSNTEGVQYRQDEYAVCTTRGFYVVAYRAPVLHFYDLYHPAFQVMVQSFRFVS